MISNSRATRTPRRGWLRKGWWQLAETTLETLPGRDGPLQARPGLRITIEGLLFVLLTLSIGLAAVNSGANLLYLALSVMLAMLGLSGFLAQLNMNRLWARRNYPPELHADQPTPGSIVIHNRKRLLQSYGIGVQDVAVGPFRGSEAMARAAHTREVAGEAQAIRTYALIVGRRERVESPIMLRLRARGVYRLSETRVSSRFPFGFFERARVLADRDVLVVYPALLPTASILPHFPHELGDWEGDRKGVGVSLFGIRTYLPDDPARHIHWKHSAKGQGLKLKEFEREESRSYLLMLDARQPLDGPQAAAQDRDFERAISVTATLAQYLIERGVMVGVWTPLGTLSHSIGRIHLRRILRMLAQLTPLPPDAHTATPAPQEHEALAIWIEFLPPEQRASRRHLLRAHGGEHHAVDTRRIQVQ